MSRLLRALSQPLRRHWLFLCVMYAIGLCVTYVTLPQGSDARIYDLTYEELFFDSFLLTLLLCLVPKRVGRGRFSLPLNAVAATLVYIAAYALAFIDIHCFTAYDSTINPTMLMLVQETTTNEAMEFFSGIDWERLIFNSKGGALILILLAQCLVYLLRTPAVRRIFRKALRIGWTRPHWLERADRCLLYSAAVLALAGFVYTGCATFSNKLNFCRLMTLPTIGAMEKHFNMPETDRAHLYQPVYRLLYSLRANQLTERQISILRENLYRTEVDSCEFRVPDIVLIIGESYNKHHSQLYGYDKPTTPRQARRKRRHELVLFSDVVTTWNLTSFCFKNMLSYNAIGEAGDWCDHSLFPAVFRKAGYKVFFMTNQFLPKKTDAVFDVSGGFFLNDDTLSRAQFDVRNRKLYRLDAGLLAEYDSLAGQRAENNLTIFHLYGQHMAYKKRYPQTRARWTFDDYDRPDLLKKYKYKIAEYDNATLYNDSIVNAILTRFEDKDAVVLYLSDHAEEVFGNKYYKCGRIHATNIDLDIAREEYEIPMWIWCSRRFRRTHWQLWRQIKAAKDQPWMTDQLPHILTYLAGIHTKEYRPELNPLDAEHYNPLRPRLLKALVDYNKLKSNHDQQDIGVKPDSNLQFPQQNIWVRP